jgi:hypothetical protein
MASKDQIEAFLRDFKYKLDFWGLLLRSDRGKNFTTITQLEYSVEDVKKELRELEFRDYAEGPVEETLYGGADMWVFGKVIQSKEVYIKITMGQASSKVLCISFHFAESSLNYPYKK